MVHSEEVDEALERAKTRYVVNRDITYTRDEEGRLLEPSYYKGSRTKTLLDELD